MSSQHLLYSMILISLGGLASKHTASAVALDSGINRVDDADYSNLPDLHAREALNVQERDDLMRILTNNIRTGRELYDKDIRDYLFTVLNDIHSYLLANAEGQQAASQQRDNKWARALKRDSASAKRQQISVSHLAQLLSSMKTRDTQGEEGVKLQSLRFGRK